jgi:phosphatidylglycerol lysyltransferase
MRRMQDKFRKGKLAQAANILSRYKLLQFLIPAAVIAFLYWQGRKEFRRIDWGMTIHLIRSMPPSDLLLLFAMSLVAVAVISGYDFIIRRHFRIPIGKWATFRYAWIANTSNSVIGFAGIAGAGLRTILYRKRGVPLPTIAASIAFLSTVTITGLSIMAWAGIIGILPIQPVLRAHAWIRYVVWADALFLPLFILMQRTRLLSKWFNRDKGRLDWGTIFASVGVSLLEWLLAGLTFWLIGSRLLPGLSVTHALGIFTASSITGLVSMAPGGIGGFDLTALLGLGLLGYDPGKAAAVLVLYRLLYYIAPWVIGLVMAAYEFTVKRRINEDEPAARGLDRVLSRWQQMWRRPGQLETIGELGAWALGKLVFATGSVLLLSAALPRLLGRLRFADELISAPLTRLSHLLSVTVGLMLLVLSWGISHRVRRAYWWTLSLLGAGAVFTFAKAFDYEEAIFLLIVCWLLWISRNEFTRSAVPFGREDAAKWVLSTLFIAVMYVLIGTGTTPGLKKYLPAGVDFYARTSPSHHIVTAIVAVAVTWVMILLMSVKSKRLRGKGAEDHDGIESDDL